VEYFARLRSLDAMQRSDVVFLVLDALDGVTQQDKAIAGEAVKDRKPIAIIVNKWDLVHAAFRRDGGIPGSRASATTARSTRRRSSTGSSSRPGRPSSSSRP
jgi:tRNA U34 5-carboxymethylaminomethyl modifying GTPase MnmE/TrmE